MTFLHLTLLPLTFLHLIFLPLTFLPLTFLLLTFLPLTLLPLTFLPLTFLPGTTKASTVTVVHIKWRTGEKQGIQLKITTPVDYGGTYAYSLSRDTPYLGKTDGPLYGLFHIISTPSKWTFSTWPLISGTLWWPVFSFFSFLRARKICVHILPLPLLLGDFNVHVDDPKDNFAKSFMGGVDSLGFKQHVHEHTHRAGHTYTLDLLFTRDSDDIDHVNLLSSLPSDHSALVATVNLTRPPNPKKEVSFRKFRSIDMDSLRNDIKLIFNPLPVPICPSKAADQYNTSLGTLIDKHAPLQVKTVTIRPKVSWFTEDVQEAKRRRRRAERRMIKSGLCIDRELYRKECDSYYECIYNARSTYLKNLIADADTKQLFNMVKSLSSPNQSSILPDHSSDSELANRFAKFFSEKVSNVVSSFTDSVPVPAITSSAAPYDHELSKFCLVSDSEVKKLIKSLPSKHCKLDPIPTWLLKDTLDELLPVITKLFNLSLSSAHVPESFKTSLLLPLLKKPNLDPNGLNNYRPIANLPFLGKVLERIVAAQLKAHLERFGMLPAYQSAYRNHHSTETASDHLRLLKWSSPGCRQGQWSCAHPPGLHGCIWHHRPYPATSSPGKWLFHHWNCAWLDTFVSPQS